MGLYQKRDQYLFASKVIRDSGTPQPFEMLKGIDFRLPYEDIRKVDLMVTYDSLQGSATPSYKLEDLSNAVSVLARGFDGNSDWGPALATLVGATSDAIKSFGMERHVSRGLNITSDFEHAPCERLIRINKNWSRISKSIRSEKFDFVLSYKNEKGEEIKEVVTKFSAGVILALINFKDGSKKEKITRKLESKDHGKRKRDGNEEKEGGGSKKSTRTKGRNKRRKGNFPQTRNDSEVVAEDEILKETSPKHEAPKLFPVRMVPRNVHYSSDSDSSDSESDSVSDSDTKVIAQEETIGMGHNKHEHPSTWAVGPEEKQIEFLQQTTNEFVKDEDSEFQKFVFPKIEAKTAGEYLEKRYKYPPFDYSKAPKPFPVRMVPRNIHYSSDSADFSDSDSEASAEEELELQKENSPKYTTKEVEFQPNATTEGDKTRAEPKEALDFDPQTQATNKPVLVQPGPNAPASSILVKHGTKRPAEAGDKDSKRAKTTQE